MSKVISFRLDADNSRETRAIDVLHAWTAIGYSLRYILTEALLKLEHPKSIPSESVPLDELTKALDHINKVLEQLGGSGLSPINLSSDEAVEPGLTSAFITSVKEIAKPGLRDI